MKALAVLVVSLIPLAAHAEVLDKALSFGAVVASALFGAVAAFLAARYRPWLLLLVLPPVLLLFAAHLLELTDPFVGRALLAEAGVVYVVVSWVAPIGVAAATMLGFYVRGRFSHGA